MVAAAIAGSAVAGLAGSAISASGAKSAASQQAAAANQAAQLQHDQYLQTRSDLSPYNTAGQSNLGPLSNYYQQTQGLFNTAFNNAQNAIPTIPNQATLLNLPSYQFNLDQGLKAVQSQATANGLGLSGAATKAAQNYATGLADNYLGQYFQMGQTQFADQSQQLANALSGSSQVFNQLYNPASLGENAAAQTGSIGANLAQSQGNLIAAAGQAQAAGTGTAAGALSQGIGGLGNNALAYALLGQGGSGTDPITGIGNLLGGYQYNGMAGGSMLNNLNTQATNYTSGGAAGL